MKDMPSVHPGACKKLIRFFRKVRRETGAWNIRETARQRGLNQRYVHDNLIHGIEPTNPDIRERLFLPRKKRICKTCKQSIRANGETHEHKPLPEWMKQWRAVPKPKRDDLIEGLMTDRYTVVKK